MRKLVFIFIGLLALGLTGSVFAHYPAQDGDTNVELHIEPNDVPVAKTPMDLEFVMEDINSSFDLKSCGCSLTITENYQTLLSLNLPDATKTISFTFPANGTYHIRLSNSIHAFSWDIPITSQANIFQRLIAKIISLLSHLRNR